MRTWSLQNHHRSTRLFAGCLGICCVVFSGNENLADEERDKIKQAADDYLENVKPILKQKCFACHAARKQEGDLRLDTVKLMRKGGDSGAVVVSGSLEKSLIWQRVRTSDEDERMPPEAEPLNRSQLAILKKWIQAGANAPPNEQPQADPASHWSFQPLQSFQGDIGTGAAVIDQFIDKKLAENSLRRSPPADDVTLIRRLFLDLHGLPPSPEELNKWSNKLKTASRLKAVRDLIDSLLKSPRYGERWGQHWLDVVRYADTHGFEVNTPRPNAWPYRDYVINAFNTDKPYSQFILEQLAGDTVGKDIATGFLVAAPVLLPGQIGKDEPSKRMARQDSLDEIIVGTGATFLGLTIGCARCHEHKFDPITQQEYYAIQAFFSGVSYGNREISDEERKKRHAQADLLATELANVKPQFDEPFSSFSAKMFALDKKIDSLRNPRMVYGGLFRKPEVTHLLNRGDSEQPREVVQPKVPAVIGSLSLPLDAPESSRRVALAKWIASPKNPLTCRVMVNRIWQYHFGTGIVETPSDFGNNGSPPSHGELLDWLAGEFLSSGGSVKHIHRLILMSKTYQQSATINPQGQQTDAACKLLWRFPSRRLESEAIRDCMLSASGNLNLKMGGPGFNFFKTRGGLSGFPPLEKFGPNEFRRMIYAHKIRMEPVPVFGAFDCPDAGQAMPKRSQSTTAIQALNLFNSPFVIGQSEIFANRIQSEAGTDISKQMERAFLLAFGRAPSQRERALVLPVLQKHGLATLCRVIFNSNEFLFLP